MLNQFNKTIAQSHSSIFKKETLNYIFNKKNHRDNIKDNAVIVIKAFFAYFHTLISKPYFVITPNQVHIHLCFYNPTKYRSMIYQNLRHKSHLNFKRRNRLSMKFRLRRFENFTPYSNSKIKNLGVLAPLQSRIKLMIPQEQYLGLIYLLSILFNKKVVLELIPLKYPYQDSEILAQLLGKNSKYSNFRLMRLKLFRKATVFTSRKIQNKSKINPLLPTVLAGIKIKVAGRLLRQRIVPKKTVLTTYKGGLMKTKDNFVDSSTFTTKNKRGAYSIRVWMSHRIKN